MSTWAGILNTQILLCHFFLQAQGLVSPTSGLYAPEGITQYDKVQRGQVAYPRGHNQVWQNSVSLIPMLAKSVMGEATPGPSSLYNIVAKTLFTS